MALGLKGKDAYTIEGEVDGFRAKTGALWQVNTTAHVYIAEEGINAKIGASIGIATYPDEAHSKPELIRTADKRMYEDKAARKTGR